MIIMVKKTDYQPLLVFFLCHLSQQPGPACAPVPRHLHKLLSQNLFLPQVLCSFLLSRYLSYTGPIQFSLTWSCVI